MKRVNALLSDRDIKKVMEDPVFIEEAREGSGILTEIQGRREMNHGHAPLRDAYEKIQVQENRRLRQGFINR